MNYQNDYDTFLATKQVAIKPSGVDVGGEINRNLFDWQRDITRWSIRLGRCGLFEAPGLGKTLQQLCYAEQIVLGNHAKRVLILAPLAVAKQTKRESEKFGINVDVNVCREQPEVKRGITVTNYERLHKFDPSQFEAVVLDESSILKSLTSKTRESLTAAFERTQWKLCCTATPAPNDYMELGNHAEFLNVMTRAEMLSMFFVHDGGETSKWRLRGHAAESFWKWMGSWSLMIRKPSDIGYADDGFIMPELRYHDIVVENNTKQAGVLFAIEASTLSERRNARRSSLDARVEAASSMANASDRPWIMWCDLNDESESLHEAIKDSVEVRGSDSIDEKEEMLNAFSEGQIRVMVTKPSIAGFGLNWQHCGDMAFVGLSDSYESQYQAIRRCLRFGRVDPVNVWCITSEQEGAVVQNVRRKEHDADKLAEQMIRHMSDITSVNIKGTSRMTSEYKTKRETGRDDSWELRLGDCVEEVQKLASDSVGYSVFSPPFASLYVYSNSDRDMGNCKDYEEFWKHFRFLTKELLRVVQPGRLVSVHCMNLPTTIQHHGEIGIQDFRGDIIRQFVSDGFIFHSEVCIWKDPVTAMQRTKALGLLHKQITKDSCMSRMGIPDYVCTFRKNGKNKNPVSGPFEHFIGDQTTFAHEGNLSIDIWQRYASPIWSDIRPNRTLQYTTARDANDDRHICPLQLDVVERCIDLWSNEGDLVLSPFAGIGTEGFVAVSTGRRFIGFELKESYFRHAVKNLKAAEKEWANRNRTLFAKESSK